MDNARVYIVLILDLEVVEHLSNQGGSRMLRFDSIETPVHAYFSLNVSRITAAKLQGNIVVVSGSRLAVITNTRPLRETHIRSRHSHTVEYPP